MFIVIKGLHCIVHELLLFGLLRDKYFRGVIPILLLNAV